MKRWIHLLVLAVFLTAWLPASGENQSKAFYRGGDKVMVDAADLQALKSIQAAGAERLADYGSFSLWRIPDNAAQTAGLTNATASMSAVAVDDGIYLRGITIRPGEGEPIQPQQLQQKSGDQEGFWIVQFAGPIQPEWLDMLLGAGLEVVAYLPNYAYVVWGRQPDAALNQLAASHPVIQWTGAYHPAYRLSPGLRAVAAGESPEGQPAETVDVTVQFYNTIHLKESVERLGQTAVQVYQPPVPALNLTNMRVQLPAKSLAEVAAWPDVFNVETYHPPELLDEIQGQILAGNLVTSSASIASGPGYLDWLDSKGFPNDPASYPIVALVDDGMDAGDADRILHPDFFTSGNTANGDRVVFIDNCTANDSGNGVGGHGNLNAGIIMGYNAQDGFPYKDSAGYSLGLGISPHGQLGSMKVFTNTGVFDMSQCDGSFANILQSAYDNGARITSNSWGAPVGGVYDADAQLYDILTRDAAADDSGNQEMLHIFAAGNSGPTSGTIGSPATAKNVITVGATENVRDEGVADGCLTVEGNNADDIARFSSRGPTADGRAKPDIMAPGTHVQGPASQDPGFNGNGVCGGGSSTGSSPTPYYPVDQTLYTWSSGTSHSTPAISGVAQLAYEYYSRIMNPGETPSPAMLKALILNVPRYLTGEGANDTLPSPSQGWGNANMGLLFDNTPRIIYDQTKILQRTGDVFTISGEISDPNKPLHISLVWTDAAGTPTASSVLVNDLDLEVIAFGNKYYGNVFSGRYSTTGGTVDKKNNVENVFLPAGEGAFQVKVTARNLAGDGVPGSGSRTDQDFALVVYNGVEKPAALLTVADSTWEEVAGNENGFIDPGETIGLTIELENQGNLSANQVIGRLESPDPAVTILNGESAFSSINPGETRTSTDAFLIKIEGSAACNHKVPISLQLSYDTLEAAVSIPELYIGQPTPHSYNASSLPVNIPDYGDQGAGEVNIEIPISDSYKIADVDVAVDIEHPWTGDLSLSLISPEGVSVDLSSGNGRSGDNYTDTIFDDQAETSITAGIAPFTGRYKPESPLSVFDDQEAAGTWKLNVKDGASNDIGQVNSVELMILEGGCEPYQSPVDVLPPDQGNRSTTAPGRPVEIPVQITNQQTVADSFDISFKSRWPVQLSAPSTGTVGPGESITITVVVTPPETSRSGEQDRVVITARSTNDSSIQGNIALTVQIASITWAPYLSR